jgi:hypothetical protein
MEHAGTIVVDDDAHLAMFIVFQYEEYCSDNGDENWTEFIERALQRRYAPEGTEPDIAPTRLAEIGRNAIDAYGEMMNGRALYDCLAGNLKMNDEEIIGAGFSSLQEFMADAPKLTVRVEYKPGDDKIITTSVYDHRTGTFWTQEQISERGIESFASVADLKVVLNWNLNGDESKYRFSWKDTWPTLYKGIARVYQ